MRKILFYFSEFLIATVAYGALTWYFIANRYIFSPHNREISWIILLLFGVGVGLVVYHLLHLYREDSQLRRFFEQAEQFSLSIKRARKQAPPHSPQAAANTFRKTVDTHFALLSPSLIKERVYRAANMLLTAGAFDQDTLASLLQQKVEARGGRIRYIAGILVMIGLLGTFLGLVQAIQYLQEFFKSAPASINLNKLFFDMEQSLGGLDKAFGTSIGGITGYLVLGYLNIVLRAKQTHILNQIEEATLEHLAPAMQGLWADQQKDAPAMTVEMIQNIPAALSEQLSTALDQIVQRTLGGCTDDLKATTTQLAQAADSLRQGQGVFSDTLQGFGGFLETFQEGRAQLVSSQETLAAGITEFSGALDFLQENQRMLASSLEMLKDSVSSSETRLQSMDGVMQGIQEVWTNNRQVFEQLAGTIQHEHQTLAELTGRLQEFLQGAQAASQSSFQQAHQNLQTLVSEHAEMTQKLLEAHTLLTTLLHDMKTFILDEQNGLHVLSSSLDDTFGEARFQYHQLTENMVELHKRLQENQAQLAQVQDTTTEIQQHVQGRR